MTTTYPQLDAHALELLESACERMGSISEVAKKIGYTRPSVSLAKAGKYPGDTTKMRAAIITNLTELIACPYLQINLTQTDCQNYRDRPVPTSSRAEVKHWQTCQSCPFNPRGTQYE